MAARYLPTELSDDSGNIVYPHSEADIIWMQDGRDVEEVLKRLDELLNGITGISSVRNLDDATKLATAKAVNSLSALIDALNNNLGGCSLERKGNDFYIVGADSVRKKLGSGLKLLHIRYVVGASNYSPYGSINVQFLNESATYLAQSNAAVYGYAGSGTPSFDGSSSPWAVTVPAGWEAVTGTDISKYRYIWITYGWSTSVAKVVSDFDIK